MRPCDLIDRKIRSPQHKQGSKQTPLLAHRAPLYIRLSRGHVQVGVLHFGDPSFAACE